MRIIFVFLLLIGVFAMVGRLVPTGWHLPLYCLFLVAGLGYAYWERQRLHARRALLQEEYRAHRAEWEAGLQGEEE